MFPLVDVAETTPLSGGDLSGPVYALAVDTASASILVDPHDSEKLLSCDTFHGTIVIPHPTAPHTFFAVRWNGGIFIAQFTDTD